MKMRELLITTPVHKDPLSSLSRPFAVLQMPLSRSSCRPLLSFSRLSTYLQPFLLSSLCCPSVVPASLHPSLGRLRSMLPYKRPRSDKQKTSATVSGVPRGVWVRRGGLLTLALHAVFVVVVDDGLESNITIYLGVTAKESI